MRKVKKRPAALGLKTKSLVLDGRTASLLERLATTLHTSEGALANVILDVGLEPRLLALEERIPKAEDLPEIGPQKAPVLKFKPSGQALKLGRCAFCGDRFRACEWLVLANIPFMDEDKVDFLLWQGHARCARRTGYRPEGKTMWSTVDRAPITIWTSVALGRLKKECAP